MTPLIGDDYVYSFIYQTPNKLSSLTDVIHSQYLHYYQWGGRSIVHFINQTLLLINNFIIIDIINSLGFIFFILLIHTHIIGKAKKISLSTLLISFFLTWILQPTFAETTLWITGSSNYLWGTLIILFFLLPYRLYQGCINSSKFIRYIQSFIFIIIGIIAGWTNENSAAGMIVAALLFIIYYNLKKWNTPLWAYTGIVGAIIGYIIMIIAPGNFIRAEGTSISPFLVLYRFLTSTQSFVEYLGVLNLGTVILFILLRKFSNTESKNIFFYGIAYGAAVIISIYIMCASPGFPPRTWYGPITFNIILFGIFLYNLNYKHTFLRLIKYAIITFFFISFGFSFYDAFNDVRQINAIWKERMIVIKQKQENGDRSVTFKEYQAKTKFGLGDAPYAKKYISDYYGMDFNLE